MLGGAIKCRDILAFVPQSAGGQDGKSRAPWRASPGVRAAVMNHDPAGTAAVTRCARRANARDWGTDHIRLHQPALGQAGPPAEVGRQATSPRTGPTRSRRSYARRLRRHRERALGGERGLVELDTIHPPLAREPGNGEAGHRTSAASGASQSSGRYPRVHASPDIDRASTALRSAAARAARGSFHTPGRSAVASSVAYCQTPPTASTVIRIRRRPAHAALPSARRSPFDVLRAHASPQVPTRQTFHAERASRSCRRVRALPPRAYRPRSSADRRRANPNSRHRRGGRAGSPICARAGAGLPHCSARHPD